MSADLEEVDYDKTCRGCLSQNFQTFQSIFNTPGLLTTYTNCTWIKYIKADDGLPTNLCSRCIDNCLQWSKFATNCKHTELKLQNIKQIKQNKIHTISNPQIIDEIKGIKDPVSTEKTTELSKVNGFTNVVVINNKKPLLTILKKNLRPINQIFDFAKRYPDLKSPVIVLPKNNMILKCGKIVETQSKTMNITVGNIEETVVATIKSEITEIVDEIQDPLMINDIKPQKVDLVDKISTITLHNLPTDFSKDINLNENNKTKSDDVLLEFDDIKSELMPENDCLAKTPLENTEKLISDDNEFYFENKRIEIPPEQIFNCEKCEKTFNSVKLRKHHLILQHEPKRFKCTKCGKLFAMREYLTNHYKRHLGIKPHKCEICNKRFSHKPHLRTHMVSHSDECPYLCSYCGKSFKGKEHLKVHTRKHTGERPYSCEFCEWKFSCVKYLTYHTNRLHPKELCAKMNKTYEPFKCSICDKEYKSKIALDTHILIHDERNRFQCDICKAFFFTKRRLVAHFTVHKNATPFSCTICCKAFKRKSSLALHIQAHSTDRPYSCNVCNKTYKTAPCLTIHKRIHTGNTFNCHICNRKFVQNDKLKAHMMIHSDVRPFSCTMCDRKFTSKFNCELHIRTHTGEKPFSCTICDKSFKLNSLLTKHKQKEHSDCVGI